MDEDEGFLNATNDLINQDLSSSKSWDLRDNKGRAHYEQEKQMIGSKIVHGNDTIPISSKFAMNCKRELNVLINRNGPSAIINVPEIENIYELLKSNLVKIRLVTEITSENLRYCKMMLEKYGINIKHLSDIKGNFAISDDREYLASPVLYESKPIPEITYSNVKTTVDQNQFIFEILWKKAVPVEQRIREIEEGMLPIETYLINNSAEALLYAQDFVRNAHKGFSNSTSIGHFKLLDQNQTLLQEYLNCLSKHKEGSIRWVTYIDDKKENIGLIKKFLDIGIQIKHVKNLPPLYFLVSQKQCVTALEDTTNEEMFQRIIHSTESLHIFYYQRVFEKLWEMGIDAQERIRQIETDITLKTIKVIENPHETKQYFKELVQNATEEILILFPSLNAVKREVIIGIIDLIKQKSTENIRVRILSPVIENVKEIMFRMDPMYDKNKVIENVICREIRKQDDLISTIIIVDKKYVLATELKDDSKELFEEAIGLSMYSISKPTVLAYISIFESLWTQTEMSDDLKTSNEKLVQSEQLERDFINTAAHELRTPTQAIMGYTEIDKEIFNDILEITGSLGNERLRGNIVQLHKHFEALSRNASRLDDLINNLLDVARIESNRNNSLQLHKQKLDLVKEINTSIKIEFEQKLIDKDIQINFINDNLDEQCWIDVDRSRLNQIINNLIGNAIKFSNHYGKIDIIIEENSPSSESDNTRKDANYNEFKEDKVSMQNWERSEKAEVFVAISDTGKGISPQIMPKLFEKFITGSDTGTGLGLYITRNLVEAHGGRIWAFNNADGIGSTFVFSLPRVNSNTQTKIEL
ncbi:MAG TPA: HAMP domain-containing sensor histidine kinase [Candidatus Saccharimonadales bacterium]|nr:HAMP domain-containing sensor histidine kinase [Candidatus Saccharimonadales bacterium]